MDTTGRGFNTWMNNKKLPKNGSFLFASPFRGGGTAQAVTEGLPGRIPLSQLR